jgi:(1->4)-alpha-D-glucan 1-alpha-D-glucosylmutase
VRPLRATYRLQLTPRFGFGAARELVPYLRDLGISHLYLSPSLQARPDSTHGYDVIDPGRLSDALGGESEFRALAAAAHAAGLGIVLDVVPNHMAADEQNRYWADPALRERFFDIDPVTGRHRRFFDIDELAAVRQEDAVVFEATHERVLQLLSEDLVEGLRVDHPDGLADPAGYLSRLRERGAGRVWVEKILSPGEPLRDWPVSGTVGYEFLNDVAALFVDPAGEETLTALWEEVSGDRRPFCEVAREAKLAQLDGTLRPELERLAREFGNGSPPDAATPPDAARPGLAALARALASLPVYRTYVEPWSGRVAPEDRSALAAAELDPALATTLLLERPAPAAFVTRFQQTTPAVTAKGVEDTAFYRYGRLLALNDVGGDPGRFAIGVDRFHAANTERAERFPDALLTTMTHDAKRSADVRARIGVLASMAEEWTAGVRAWLAIGERLAGGPAAAPDRVEQYFLLQTLAGAWPISPQRLEAYMEKAVREAKRNTNWVAPDADWERGVRRFVGALLADAEFMAAFEPFAARVAVAGARAAHGQLVLKLTSPGVPDIYQGDELELRALVDPDNRRPVDWELRERLLALVRGGAAPDRETRKLWLSWKLLGLRARRPDAFGPEGSYVPIEAGPTVMAYLRGGDVLVAVAVRDPVDRAEIAAPAGRWRDALRGGEVSLRVREPVAGLLEETGVTVLERAAR